MAIQVNRLTFVSMKGIIIIGFLIIQGLTLTSCQESDHVCSSKMTCSDCITSDPQCVWCKAKDDRASGERCRTLNTMNNKCAISDIVNPQQNFTRNRERSLSPPNTNVKDIVQLWPQEVTLKTRIKSPFKFQVKFRQAEDYPVDLYFLMDMSYSMLDDKQKLAALGNLLGETMGKITRNFRLGFGSFVDKKVGPYVNTSPEKLREPCPNCAAPYGFINHMPLAKDVDNFVTKVSESRISGNLDTPEGAFDAMMQAIVCQKDIGWRKDARKILLVATDAGFHLAGDGKLGGIVKPNDEACHLDGEGMYTESTNLDYPSISQINNKVKENKINVIFAATAGAFSIYRDLKDRIGSSFYAGQLSGNSDNIVTLIAEQYKEISSNVELKDSAPNNVQVTYASKCLDASKSITNKCNGLKVGSEVEFDVEIEVLSCPANESNRKIKFEISPVGLAETLVVHLELKCECGCQQHKEAKSVNCSSLGTYECGVCICPEGHTGQHCECDTKAMLETKDDDTPCTPPGQSVVCSGWGSCACKQCVCYSTPEKKIYGPYCECDDVNCPLHKGQLCGGKERGSCNCRQCKCLAEWTGEACECPATNKTCQSSDGTMCSNNGECVCGECRCRPGFIGQTCESPQAREARCNEFKECAHCYAFQQPITATDCNACAELQNFELVDKAEAVDQNEVYCVFKDDDSCNFYFVYTISEGSDIPRATKVQKTKECPKPVNVLVIVLAVVGAIVAIGLALLLLWKIVTTIYDRREYAKFVKDCDQAKWERAVNPMYKPSTSTFANPMYDATH